jgi:hypothetical protein
MAALEHREADRVPVGEFFWTNFVRRCKAEMNVGSDFNPYAHWDLDLIVVNPNMDPHIRGIEVIEDTPERKLVRTGFEATIERRSTYPMPSYLEFGTQSYEEMEAFAFDDPLDPRRYFEAIDDQINCVGDELVLGLPSYVDRVKACAKDFCVFGSVCEPHEMMWRILGTENVLMKMAEGPDQVAAFVERLGDFLVGIVEGQVAAAEGALKGLYIWGDVAFVHGMLFSPDFWREAYKPQLTRICAAAHKHGLKTVYHGCGNASVLFEDMIEAGVDCYNPLEAKSGLDVVELKRQYGARWAFNGNINVQVLETNDREKVRAEVLRKLNAAKGGGYILQSDHSMPSNVDPATYDYVIQLLREYGNYPLDLGEFDENV